MPKKAGTVTNKEVSDSTRKRKTIVWEKSSETTDLVDKPARL